MKKKLVAFLLAQLAACSPDVVMRGYVDVREPGGEVQKVRLTCRRLYDTRNQTVSITGVSFPITSVIKPSIGGVSTGISYQALSDQIEGLDIQQIAICESLILDPAQSDIRQTLKDYVGATGYLTLQIRTLNNSTSIPQYQQAAASLASKPTATVAPTTAQEVQKNSATLSLPSGTVSIPKLGTFSVQPSLSDPPSKPTNPATPAASAKPAS